MDIRKAFPKLSSLNQECFSKTFFTIKGFIETFTGISLQPDNQTKFNSFYKVRY